MPTAVAFLRAVNVGGRSLPMTELRDLFERLGARHVLTYIQSGNVVFDLPTRAGAKFASVVERALDDDFGLHSAVVVRSAAEVRRVVARVPFPADERPSVHVGFFKSEPTPAEIRDLSFFDADNERVRVAGRECFLYLPDGAGRAKLPIRLNRLSTPVTIRNLRTVSAVVGLATRTGPEGG